MNKTVLSSITILCLLSTIVLLGFAFNIQKVKASGTIYIRADGSVEGTTDISTVDKIIYTFTNNIFNQSVVVERDNIVVDGAGYTLQGTGTGESKGIELGTLGNSAVNVTIKNMQISGFEDGIRLEYSTNNTIVANNITDNDCGIWLYMSHENTLSENKITGNSEFGICILMSDGNTVSENNFEANDCGLRLWTFAQGVCSHNVVRANTILRNRVGFSIYQGGYQNTFKENILVENIYNLLIHGSIPSDASVRYHDNNLDVSNTVNGRPVYYWVNQHDKRVPSDAGFVGLVNSTNITISGLNLTNNGQGILLVATNSSTVENITCSHNLNGATLYRSHNNILNGNTMINNVCGISLSGSTNNTLRNNNMTDNELNFAGDLILNDVDASNTVDGKPIYRFVDQHDFILDSSTCPQGIGCLLLLNCSNITIRNLTLTHNQQAIRASSLSNSIIENVTISYNQLGVSMVSTSNCTIRENIITNNYRGIGLSDSDSNKIFRNLINNNDYCIGLSSSSNNTISGNTIANSGYDGISLKYGSLNNTISGNSIRKNDYGIYVEYYSSNNTIVGNDITENKLDGVCLTYSSNNNSIFENNIASNQFSGITIAEASGNTVVGNNVEANAWIGIYLSDSPDNTIYHNNFANNAYQVFTENSTNNIWDDGYPSGGNYWSDHVCTGNPSDGSQPYVIDENNIDHYPFQDPIGWLLLGDINSDGTVDIFDVVLAALAFGSTPDDPSWNQAADLNNDGVVDIFDIVLLANDFGKTA